jgi:hypothetical protein
MDRERCHFGPREEAGGRYAVGFFLQLPARRCSGSAAFLGEVATI